MKGEHTRRLTSQGQELSEWDQLEASNELLQDPDKLRHRLHARGYLYLRDYLDRALVEESYQRLLDQLEEHGVLDSAQPKQERVACKAWEAQSFHHLAPDNEPLLKLLYRGRMIELYESLLQDSIRHFDFTWMRIAGPGYATAPHADSVFMNRGTENLYTSWTPLHPIPPEMGGLMVLPKSHQLQELVPYFESDVDTVCVNKPPRKPTGDHAWVGPVGDGKLTLQPANLAEELNCKWLTSPEFQPGDVLLFSICTIHASLDNQTDKLRLSADSRYQRASEPADERWIGANPKGHGKESRRELIC